MNNNLLFFLKKSTKIKMNNKKIQEFLKKNIPEWSDEERIQTLFTAFREIKDENYDTFIESNNDKVFFWKNVIFLVQQEKLLNQNDNVLTFPGKNLDQFFCRNGLTPSCIGSVIVSYNYNYLICYKYYIYNCYFFVIWFLSFFIFCY